MLAVMFLSMIGITLASMWTVWEHYRLGWDRWRMAGQIFAEWVHAMDGRGDAIGQSLNWSQLPGGGWSGGWDAIRDDLHGGSAADLPVSGLGADAGLQFGSRIADEAMQFSFVHLSPSAEISADVCEDPATLTARYEERCRQAGAALLVLPGPGRLDAVRRGLIDGGLESVAIADAGGDLLGPDAIVRHQGWLTHAHRFGSFLAGLSPPPGAGKFPPHAVVALTHVSIPRHERALHRTAPSGRPDLTGMRADLDMGGPGGRDDVTVMGRDRRGNPDADTPDVEVDNVEGIARADVNFRPVSGGDMGPAARAGIVVAASLSLTSTAGPPREAHAVGIREAGLPDGLDETVTIEGNATVASAETACDRQDAGQRCVAAHTLTGRVPPNPPTGVLESRGPLRVLTDTTGQTEDSGVIAETMRADTLDLSGVCNGCAPF